MRNLTNIFFSRLFVCAMLLGSTGAASADNFISLDISGSVSTIAEGINNNGIVVGTYEDASGDIQGFTYNSNNGVYDFYPAVGTRVTSLRGINDAGDMVGAHWSASGIAFQGFYDNGTSIDSISVPGSVWIQTNDVNNTGLMTGEYSVIAGTTETSSYLYDGSSFSTFASPGASRTRAFGINDSGIIVGDYTESGNTYGFIYDGVRFTQLSVLDSLRTSARGIDNAGNIVGNYQDAAGRGHGFIYDGDVFTTIDVDFVGAYGTKIIGINELGQIVGRYKFEGKEYGFVGVSPVPVPASLFLLGSGLLGLLGMAKRKSHA